MTSETDTPRSTYSLFSQRVTLTVVGVLVGLAGVAWWSTVRQATSMSDMVSGLGQVGARAPNDMTIPIFLGMWVAMMVAMMFPTAAPMILLFGRVQAQRQSRGDAYVATSSPSTISGGILKSAASK